MSRCSNTSGYTAVREHPSDAFYLEIRSGPDRIILGTFETAHKAARAYDALAAHAQMNWTRQQAEDLAPRRRICTSSPTRTRVITRYYTSSCTEDKRLMTEWKHPFPQDVEHNAARKASRVARRKDKAERRAFILAWEAGPQTIDDDDNRWMVLHDGVRHHHVGIGLEQLVE
ncbi:uncharacterized protein [Lolium perenne]|uniref:uncharacterized protein n=1 Tax=Lolium perenne TaxID=4522 RepID=UPI0021F50BDC|nr:uncharacterized protein LOC127339644 [Lolium perenne]